MYKYFNNKVELRFAHEIVQLQSDFVLRVAPVVLHTVGFQDDLALAIRDAGDDLDVRVLVVDQIVQLDDFLAQKGLLVQVIAFEVGNVVDSELNHLLLLLVERKNEGSNVFGV
jgi:hypothetical protein